MEEVDLGTSFAESMAKSQQNPSKDRRYFSTIFYATEIGGSFIMLLDTPFAGGLTRMIRQGAGLVEPTDIKSFMIRIASRGSITIDQYDLLLDLLHLDPDLGETEMSQINAIFLYIDHGRLRLLDDSSSSAARVH